MSPLARRRWDAFRANRRGFVSLQLLSVLIVLSLGAEWIANDRPLLIRYNDRFFLPIVETVPDTAFGGFLPTEADFHEPEVKAEIALHGWMLWPPIPWSWRTIARDLTRPPPTAPSTTHWLGTDDQGRDVAARLLYGFRVSILFGLTLTLLSSLVGIAAGTLQGFLGGWTDLILQRLIEIWSGMPTLYLLIILSSVVTPTLGWLLLLLLLFSWMTLVGVVRAEALRVRNLEYVRAATALGLGPLRVMLRHIVPNATIAALSFLPFVASGAVVTLTALDFLGFGLPPGSASLGELLRQGKENLEAPWLGLTGFVSIGSLLTLLVFVGEAARDAFDPRRGSWPVPAEATPSGGIAEEQPKTQAVLDERDVATPPPYPPTGAARLPAAVLSHQEGVPAPALLEIEDLYVVFGSGPLATHAVRGVSLSLRAGETLAIVGESGSGKSATALSIARLLPGTVHHPQGRIIFEGSSMLDANEATLRRLRGARIGFVFQEPMSSLNPLHTVGNQIAETLILHQKLSREQARARTLELLELVEIDDAESRLDSLPHELSGGQRQRVMIAMALANQPALLIADEPTTAVDVTVQAHILHLIDDLRRRLGMAVLFITHDLELVRRIADRVAVMRSGLIVETGAVQTVFDRPQHPYTRALLASRPAGSPRPVSGNAPILVETSALTVRYRRRGGLFGRSQSLAPALENVSFSLRVGETLGVAGESGSGKTTLGLALLRLLASSGTIRFDGQDLRTLNRRALRALRPSMQIVFQDPFGSLSPRLSVGAILEEGLQVQSRHLSAAERETRVAAALERVELEASVRHRYPHEFSGGQRQRIAIARALVLEPRLVVLDEPTSALDVTVQAQIIALLRRLQETDGLAYLFISHDLRVVRALSHRLLVLRRGVVIEEGPTEAVLAAPREAYTRALIEAALFTEGPQPR